VINRKINNGKVKLTKDINKFLITFEIHETLVKLNIG
jgi:hypothetical protein